jgi:hypothetical protein
MSKNLLLPNFIIAGVFYRFQKNMLKLDRNLDFGEYIKQCEQMPLTEATKRENNRYWGLRGGFYANYLENWFDTFEGEKSVKIVFFDRLRTNPVELLQEVCQWLDINDNLYNSESLEIENKTVNYSNKFFHQAALELNSKSEIFLRANPQIKKALRKVYYAVNAQPDRETISEETRAYLESMYTPYNHRLAMQLREKGYTNLPDWLQFEGTLAKKCHEENDSIATISLNI